ncbi:hypothetical protein GOBAR_DD15992 [Gossypium barbadense]|nr:hypothetical protein GOBAR_DD15992 [Gossypium barbadense]
MGSRSFHVVRMWQAVSSTRKCHPIIRVKSEPWGSSPRFQDPSTTDKQVCTQIWFVSVQVSHLRQAEGDTVDCVKEKKIDSLSSFLFLSEILNNQQRQAMAFTIQGREEAAHKFCYKHEIDGDELYHLCKQKLEQARMGADNDKEPIHILIRGGNPQLGRINKCQTLVLASENIAGGTCLTPTSPFLLPVQSGARWGVFFLRFIKLPETSDTVGGHVGRHAFKLLLFFLTISVVAVDVSDTSPYPPDPVEPDGSRTESGVTKP